MKLDILISNYLNCINNSLEWFWSTHGQWCGKNICGNLPSKLIRWTWTFEVISLLAILHTNYLTRCLILEIPRRWCFRKNNGNSIFTSQWFKIFNFLLHIFQHHLFRSTTSKCKHNFWSECTKHITYISRTSVTIEFAHIDSMIMILYFCSIYLLVSPL